VRPDEQAEAEAQQSVLRQLGGRACDGRKPRFPGPERVWQRRPDGRRVDMAWLDGGRTPRDRPLEPDPGPVHECRAWSLLHEAVLNLHRPRRLVDEPDPRAPGGPFDLDLAHVDRVRAAARELRAL